MSLFLTVPTAIIRAVPMPSLSASVDQAFVTLKHWLLGFLPEALLPVASALLSIAPILVIFPLLFGLATVLERKGLGRIQNRYGPNRVGIPLTKIRLCGFGQFIADGLKMLTKEDVVPHTADRLIHFLAPITLVVPVLLAYAVLPFGRNMVPVELDAGFLFFFAVGSTTELAVFMAGWSSRNKYSLLGAMRAIAQMISYELPLVLAGIPVVMLTGTLSLPQIVAAQGHYLWHWFPAWNVFTPWGAAGFVLFMIAALAESNRSPFDLPEAESEIIAGYFTEYSGFKFALFFLGEYLGMFAVSGLAITLFLGGWNAPLPLGWVNWVPSWGWFILKLSGSIALFIWLRGTLPRLRTDQLMNFAWKFLLPMALINLLAAAVWFHSRSWTLPGGLAGRWLLCAALLAGPYLLFGRAFERTVPKRVYRYAT